ncbi:hypothetical protein BGZ91_011017 [Linnemannia elongata]|nr:hypothetical protein BGZ91_011017 [Linnemannia elongata]
MFVNPPVQLVSLVEKIVAKSLREETNKLLVELLADSNVTQQALAYGDVGDTDRKVDLIVMYKNIKLSTVEFKRTGISGKDFTVQSRKNLSLGRCLQEAHAAYGFKVVSVIMGDVAGM